jgi:hypothetical protein
MKLERVVEVAKNLSVSEGWVWSEPVIVSRKRRFVFLGPVYWEIRTNVGRRGANIQIQIDNQTERLIKKMRLLR